MIQNTQSTNIISEQNNIVKIRQGGRGQLFGTGRTYWNYNFTPLSGCLYNPEVAKIYAEIGKEIASSLSQKYIVKLSFTIKMKTTPKVNFLGKWTPATFSINESETKLKECLRNGKYGDCMWADYIWHAEFPYRSPITNMKVNTRDYVREIHILKETLDLSLIKEIHNCCIEGNAVGIRIYPHSNIKHLESEEKTIRSYIHNDDFIIHIGFDDKWTSIVIEPNPRYINYEQLIKSIEPIFEKYGLKIIDKSNPYLKDGFSLEEEYTYHNEYPCAGYEFVE